MLSIFVNAVMSSSLKRCRNVLKFAVIEQHWNEFVVHTSSVVNVLVNQIAFPSNSQTFPRFLLTHYALVISLSADHQNKVSIANLFVHPSWPAFGRRSFILVKYAVYSFVA